MWRGKLEIIRVFVPLVSCQGHDGLLCGSCLDGYGQYELSCHQCKHRGLVVLWLLGVIVYTFGACSVAIVGNLTDTETSQDVLSESSERGLAGLYGRSSQEGMQHGGEAVSAPLIACRGEGTSAGEDRESARELAKRNVTESVKVLQVLGGRADPLCVPSSF